MKVTRIYHIYTPLLVFSIFTLMCTEVLIVYVHIERVLFYVFTVKSSTTPFRLSTVFLLVTGTHLTLIPLTLDLKFPEKFFLLPVPLH